MIRCFGGSGWLCSANQPVLKIVSELNTALTTNIWNQWQAQNFNYSRMDGANLNCINQGNNIILGEGWQFWWWTTRNSSKCQANSKFTSPPPPPTFHVTIDPLSTVFFIFQAGRVLMYMVLFWPNFSQSVFLIHLFFYAGFYCMWILPKLFSTN